MGKQNTLEKMNSRMSNSIMLKLGTITVLILLLLIPSAMIKSIIHERESLSQNAQTEVSNKWANDQQIIGPVLTVPLYYEEEEIIEDKRTLSTYVKYLRILPRTLSINGEVRPESLKRGIYEVVVYESDLKVNGHFDISEVQFSQKNLKEIQWNHAELSFGISDLRGISNKLSLKVNDQALKIKQGSSLSYVAPSSISGQLDISKCPSTNIKFSLDLDLQGSQSLSFVPLGTTTEVNLSSPWSAPSFNGQFIPKKREVSEDGFTANWLVLGLNRTYPEHWTGNLYKSSIEESGFGTDLILPLDDYQKSMRSAKYAVMTIGLTFLIFFIMEIMNKRKIHPFQYALVGLSLSVFYVLLVSLSEHIPFNLAYLVSTIAIVGMITAYSLSVFEKRSQTAILSSVMTGFYGFMFVTLQLTDYALLLGSLGLVAIIGMTMYFTRNINWYSLKLSAQ